MAYCSSCGKQLTWQWVAADSRLRQVCDSCRAVYYQNPKVLVACLVHWQRRILMCRRAIEPAKGFWFAPTGFVEAGESLEEAAVRELSEETGLSLSPSKMTLYGVLSLPFLGQVYITYRTRLESEPTLTAGPESLEVRMLAESEIPCKGLAFSSLSLDLLRHTFRDIRTGSFPVRSLVLDTRFVAPDSITSSK
jgi:ADP-ribose pyrophosphatase YjhB (NUDIX family)